MELKNRTLSNFAELVKQEMQKNSAALKNRH